MRVMQIVTNFRPGGIQRHVLDLAAAMRSAGHEVVLAGDDGDWRPKDGDPDYLPLPVSALTWEGGGIAQRLSRLPPVVARLRRELARRPVDLIHAHETAPTLVARLAAFGTGIPLIMTYHGAAPERERQVAQVGRLAADRVISPSRLARDRLVVLGLADARATSIGIGVHPLEPRTPGAVAARRAELLGPYAGPLVVSLSRLSVQKGLDDMIAVAEEVVKDHPGTVFAVAGGGPLADEVAGWVAASSLGDRFRLLGPQRDISGLLRAADIFLLTSRWENLPVSIVEAFRAGLPVIATDCSGVRELVDDRVGALCPVGDLGAIAGALDRLIRDTDLRAGAGAAALLRSHEARFDPASVSARMMAFYQDVIGQGR